ncbi:hypothetical protein AVEN_91763-1 [Araneus ventricosus]|uniref:Uncharacterized protein n=1 Tax=Araneus ventricosus TaxID=182803 RepID=A0A4Y2HUT3_ARAVE|nr:hypothetical protein AVEN_91763-1 [Araneus ventricosus]
MMSILCLRGYFQRHFHAQAQVEILPPRLEEQSPLQQSETESGVLTAIPEEVCLVIGVEVTKPTPLLCPPGKGEPAHLPAGFSSTISRCSELEDGISKAI